MSSLYIDDYDYNKHEDGEEKNIISKILVEMKTQFNKNEKGEESSGDSSEEIEVIDENEREICKAVVLSDSENTALSQSNENSQVDMNSTLEDNNEDVEFIEEIEKDLAENESSSDPNFQNDNQNHCVENDDKPRIVLTFRKPQPGSFPPKNKTKENNVTKRMGKTKAPVKSEEVILKRSARRRSKDLNESVLQSAIARKEKSYNEANKPQRLTKQLKPTTKILENLANAALRMDKSKVEKNIPEKPKSENLDSDNVSDESLNNQENDFSGKNNRKHKVYRHTKQNNKKIKSNQTELMQQLYESDGSEIENSFSSSTTDSIDRKINYAKMSPRSPVIDGIVCRRSRRISSKYRDEQDDSDTYVYEVCSTDELPLNQEEGGCSTVEEQLIASKLCLCLQKTDLFIESKPNEIVYCGAIDDINEKLIGCNLVVDSTNISLLRPSTRVPYMTLCEVHRQRLYRHNCCPSCGLFCTQGQFVECEKRHQYHRSCQISVGEIECCPHCASSTPSYNVTLTMHSSKRPVIFPTQKTISVSAKMGFPTKVDGFQDDCEVPIIPSEILDISDTINSSDSEKFTIEDLFVAIKNNSLEKIAFILGQNSINLSSCLEECGGGTLMHYSAQMGLLSAIHMLLLAGSDVDVLDTEQNTPLASAIVSFQNKVVKYLIRAGASITLKGTDGMTALHLAAKCGNTEACKYLIEASLEVKNYIDTPDDGGWTPLVWACEHNKLDVVRYLLLKGADVTLRDVEHNVALHWAAFSGTIQIVELLLNKGCDINAVNVQGDSPLHIAARQDNYNCVLVLLARGADVTLANKAEETPLDCASQSSSCYAAISLNVFFQSTCDRKLQRTILCNDISNGKEKNPIQCVNMVDDEPKPIDFVYISHNCITSDSIQIDQRISTLQSCSCEETCVSLHCICCNNSLKCWYDNEGRLSIDFNYADPPMLFECNQLCSCNAITCGNRVVQRGLTQRFQVYKTERKGWGVCTLNPIPKGSFVCEYIGEIIADLDADQRKDDSYLFDLDSRDGESYCIDAKKYGNLARFINHSCEANLLPVRVFVDHQDLRFPRIAFFANRDIQAMEELSFDYGEKFWLIKYKHFTCECRSSLCKYSEENILLTLENYTNRMNKEGMES